MVEGGQKQAAQCCCQKGRGEGGPYDQERDPYPSSLASVSTEMIPCDQISFRLHIHEGRGPALSTLC